MRKFSILFLISILASLSIASFAFAGHGAGTVEAFCKLMQVRGVDVVICK